MKKKTQALHVGYDKQSYNGEMSLPISQTTAYAFRDSQHAADLFSLKELGPIYTRLTNPTTDVFEQRFAAIEGGVAALALASGQSAIFFSIVNVAQAGDNILISDKLYGGAVTLLGFTLKRFGITAKVFSGENPDDLENQIDGDTKAIFFEALSNPQVAVADIEAIVKIGKKHGIVTICDNTVSSAALCNPIEWGVDIVMHSTSKYTNGQGTTIGGIIVEREGMNEFFKNNASRYPLFSEPDDSYHGLIYMDLPIPCFTARARIGLLRDFGAVASPFNSWLLANTLETLDLRMVQHSNSALKVAKFLDSHPKVTNVNYPGLESDRGHERAMKYFKDGMSSGLMSFDVSNYDAAKSCINNVELFSIVTNIGDSKSLIVHPASTTHSQLSKDELQESGVLETTIRLSIGLEDSDDIIDDLKRALEK